MTLSRPMFPPIADRAKASGRFNPTCSASVQVELREDATSGSCRAGAGDQLRTVDLQKSLSIPALAIVQPMARRGFLQGLAALLPVAPSAAVAAAVAPLPPVSVASRENWKLRALGRQMDLADEAFKAAAAQLTAAREIALRDWPAVPADCVFNRSQDAPYWCDTQLERDLDDKVVYFFGNNRGPRSVVDCWRLDSFLRQADKRTREAKSATKLLAGARTYEKTRQNVLIASGYESAKSRVSALARRIDRLVELLQRVEVTTYAGVAIQARALLVAIETEAHDQYVAYRARQLYLEPLARSILRLEAA